MIRYIRLLIRNSNILSRIFYKPIRWFALDVLKFKQHRIAKFGYQAVRIIHEAAASVNMPYYADCGTLLGFVRDHGFIAHDADMDFSMMPENGKVTEFYKALIGKGLYFERFLLMDGRLREFSLRYNEISIDFFQRYYNEQKNSLFVVADKKDDYWPVFQRPIPRAFHTINVHGVEVVVPGNTDELLQSMYGNWRTPIKKWEDSMAPKYEKDYSDHLVYISRSEEEWDQYLKSHQI